MKTFGAALEKMQGDFCHLTDAVLIWYSLRKNNNLAHLHDAIKKRFKLTLKDQEMFPNGMFSYSLQASLPPS